VYEHRLGNFCVWYDLQSEDGFIELLFNKDENLIKQFFALLVNSEIIPTRIEYKTNKHETFVVVADFENQVDFFSASIKNDILTSSNGGNNSEDTTRLFGQWIKIKIFYDFGVFQKIVDCVLKFMATSRTYNK